MTQQSHDHNFKNLFLDFPKESLEWLLPQAQNYYHVDNPVVKILLPKMRYDKKDRVEVIRKAYNGLYQLASIELFYKYVDFIDMYTQITEKEQEIIYNEMVQHKETVMLAQYIKNKGREEGRQEGTILTIQENIIDILQIRFGNIPQTIVDKIIQINDLSKLKSILKQAVQIKEIESSGLLC
ncbi:MAG: hypothetical protein AB7U45_04990 [Desulfamplus sp.]